jgi:alcohol dehydrogenase (NADP+)
MYLLFMENVKTFAAFDPKSPLKPFAINRRDPRPNDVLIEIKFCGVCHSDVHQARDEWGGSTFPMVPGHEIAGVVKAVGSSVKKFKVGDKVGVGCMVDSCQKCPECKSGFEQFCYEGSTMTYNGIERDGSSPTYGGYSTHITVREEFVVTIPDALSMDAAAPLLCAGITTYSPLKHWKAGPGKKVAVMGLGGLGHMAVKIAHAMGAEVSVLSHSENKKADALKFGATHFYSTRNEAVFTELASRFDLIINTVSAEIDWNLYLGLLARDGSMVTLGIPSNAIPIHAFSLLSNRRSLAGSPIGGIAETQEMLNFCAQHNIHCDIEKIAMDEINTAYDRMVKGDVKYRFVIDLATLN